MTDFFDIKKVNDKLVHYQLIYLLHALNCWLQLLEKITFSKEYQYLIKNLRVHYLQMTQMVLLNPSMIISILEAFKSISGLKLNNKKNSVL